MAAANQYDVLIVGAGFSGMYALYNLRKRGFSVRVLERGGDVGGTWYWNRYPGARCDIESLSYSYSFDEDLQQEWHWPHRYAYQPDILNYAHHVADRFDLRRDIQLDTSVASATFDEAGNCWTLVSETGEHFIARYCVMAIGCLAQPKPPDIQGIADFAGDLYHTADWPVEGVDLSGRRVGVIGTGSSGIQCIPRIAAQASKLTVFQRTANFSIPSWNAPLEEAWETEVKRNYGYYREKARHSYSADFADENRLALMDVDADTQQEELEKTWRNGGFDIEFAFSDVFTSQAANDVAAEFVRNKIRKIVEDPAIAEILCPQDHPFGTKRLCVDDGYFETYNRSNVSLVDLRKTPIERVDPEGVRTTEALFELDTLVLATGFDAMTGPLTNIDLRGLGGKSIRDAWADGPQTYLGLAVAGFPNLFTVTGPGSPSVLTNMFGAIEQHVEWICECIDHLRSNGIDRIEATGDAQSDWVRHVREAADATLYPQANSWYVGANVPGKPRVFMAYVNGQGPYRAICDRVARAGYEGFAFASSGADGWG